MENPADVPGAANPEDQAATGQPQGDDQLVGDADKAPNEPQGLTDVNPDGGDDMKKTVTGFQKANEKKNIKIEELRNQNLELAYKAVSADVNNFDDLDPVTQDAVAKKLGYDGITDFVRSHAAPSAEDAKTSKDTPVWKETHDAFVLLNGDKLRANKDLNDLLGQAMKEFQSLDPSAQTPALYKKIMADAEMSYEEGKKAQKTIAEISKEITEQVAPTRSGRVDSPKPGNNLVSLAEFGKLSPTERKEYMAKQKQEHGEVKFNS